MRRRAIGLLVCGAAAWPVAAVPQTQITLIGFLQSGGAAQAYWLEAFRGSMQQLGYVEGGNVRYEVRHADGVLDRLPVLAAELVELKPRVIVSGPLPSNLALQKLTTTIPIVMGTGADPVAFGLVKSLARPGGNITGLANLAEELASKQLDLVRELLPQISRIAVLINVTNPLHVPQWRTTKDAADKAGLSLISVELRGADELTAAFSTFVKKKAEAVLVPPDTTLVANQKRIIELAFGARLPTIFYPRTAAENGALISYGPDLAEGYRRAATYVDKILKGAAPADLPIEQPTKIELVINLRTAKTLGVNIPPTMIAHADQVIE
jgi:putative ABC transport system substrate-binding protein